VKATNAQIASSEKFISKMQLMYGIADDKLRPAFSTLARSTRDTAEAQDLLQVAMDVSAGTGKDLETVSLALAKAHNGNLGSLTRLGIPLDKAIIKNKDFKAALDVLTKTFNGSAKAATDTFSGKMAILQQNFNESKEQLGYALLPALTRVSDYIVKNIVPNVQSFVDGLTGVKNSGDKATTTAYDLGEKARGMFQVFKDNWKHIKYAAEYMALFFGAMKLASGITAFMSGMKTIIGLYRTLRTVSVSAAMAEAFATQGASIPIGTLAAAAVAAGFGVAALNINWSGNGTPAPAGAGSPGKPATRRGRGGGGGINRRAVGGSVSAGTSYLIGEHGPELWTAAGGGMITRSENIRGGVGGMNVVVNVSGSVIHEKDLAVSVRDNIAQLMRRRGLNPAILGV
jgi:hypothetical protein